MEERRIKTTVRYYATSIRIAETQTPSAGGDIEQREPSPMGGGTGNAGRQFGVSYKANDIQSSEHILVIYPSELKTYVHTKAHTGCLQQLPSHCQNLEATKISSRN
jgi:hypothetical protein